MQEIPVSDTERHGRDVVNELLTYLFVTFNHPEETFKGPLKSFL